jgi:RimJ/RimL family protein N-acetyltransferase
MRKDCYTTKRALLLRITGQDDAYLAIIREMRIKDVSSLHRMYNMLSEDSKRFFHPGFLGTEHISLQWLLAQISLCLSSIRLLRKTLLCLFPSLVFLPLVVISQDNVVGFAFLKIKKRLNSGFSAELGIVIDETHRGRGLGSKLMESLLKMARQEKVHEVVLTVLSDNLKAIRLCEKFGFKRVGETIDRWKGKTFKSIIMKRVL